MLAIELIGKLAAQVKIHGEDLEVRIPAYDGYPPDWVEVDAVEVRSNEIYIKPVGYL